MIFKIKTGMAVGRHSGFLFVLSNVMIPVSKGQKAVRACTIRLLNLGHAKYEVQNEHPVDVRFAPTEAERRQ